MTNKFTQEDIRMFKTLQLSPVMFIEKVWGLYPQQEGEEFVKGKHITWQQAQILRNVEWAIKGTRKKRISVRSGHGTGKSTVLSWLILWFLFCYKDAQVPCTAPTSDQMYDVLWKELSLWIDRIKSPLIKEKFVWNTDHIRINERPNTWFARAKTARKENPEALAGIHADHVMMIVDEASGVHDKIFEVAEGALTNENILVILISNPTRVSGYFFDTHHSDKDNWETIHLNSEESPIVDDQFNERIIQKYGKDSDEYRIRVQGEFPNVEGLDDRGYVFLLNEQDLQYQPGVNFVGELTMGVDPAGQGKDSSVWVLRDAFNAKVIGEEKISDPQSVAQNTITLCNQYNVPIENVIIENFGVGADVSKHIALATHKLPQTVNTGDKPLEDRTRFVNIRAESYWKVREWMKKKSNLVNHKRWKELLIIKFKAALNGKIQIMSKDMMHKEGIKSPDVADALMLTFCKTQSVNKSQYRDAAADYTRMMNREHNYDPAKNFF